MNQPPSTPERELTAPVDLATPDGRRLNPDAVGWSRVPLHRANLRGSWGRNKRWDYWAILAGDLVVSGVYADVDYLGLADVWWADLASGVTGGRGTGSPLGLGFALPDVAGATPVRVQQPGFTLELRDDAAGNTAITAHWTERGVRCRLEAVIELPPGHESLNVVIPWSARRFQYTAKHQARPAYGTLVVGDRVRTFGGSGGDAWGVLDIGRGRWPYAVDWNWGGGAGRLDDGRVIGLQLGGRWTRGTGYTENGVLLDGRLTKLGRELSWTYDVTAARPGEPLRPWRVEDPGGRLRLELAPRHDKHTRFDVRVLRTETHQVFGDWSGTIVTDAGEVVAFSGLQGFAEESHSRW